MAFEWDWGIVPFDHINLVPWKFTQKEYDNASLALAWDNDRDTFDSKEFDSEDFMPISHSDIGSSPAGQVHGDAPLAVGVGPRGRSVVHLLKTWWSKPRPPRSAKSPREFTARPSLPDLP